MVKKILFIITLIAVIVLSPLFISQYLASSNPPTKSVPIVASPEEAFKEGYSDALIIVEPENKTIDITNLQAPQVIKIKLYIKYVARRDPAPKALEVIFDLDKISTFIPYKNRYIRVEDYLSIKPSRVLVSEDKITIVYLYINLTKEFLDALKYNGAVYGSDSIPFIDIYAYTPSNDNIEEKPYKYIIIYCEPIEVKL